MVEPHPVRLNHNKHYFLDKYICIYIYIVWLGLWLGLLFVRYSYGKPRLSTILDSAGSYVWRVSEVVQQLADWCRKLRYIVLKVKMMDSLPSTPWEKVNHMAWLLCGFQMGAHETSYSPTHTHTAAQSHGVVMSSRPCTISIAVTEFASGNIPSSSNTGWRR